MKKVYGCYTAFEISQQLFMPTAIASGENTTLLIHGFIVGKDGLKKSALLTYRNGETVSLTWREIGYVGKVSSFTIRKPIVF